MSSVGDVRNIFRLDGRTAVITGAGQGLGQAIAEGFSQFGATVIVVDIHEANARNVADSIHSDGGSAHWFTCDVSDSAQVTHTVEQAFKINGKVDILASIAGIASRSPAEEMSDEQWQQVVKVNLDGSWFFNREVGRRMIERGEGGSIINMASIAGQIGLTTGNVNYSATKGGVIAMTRCLAIEWAQHNIRVNAIAPVQFKTPLVLNLLEKKPETEAYFLENIPLKRIGEVWEIVGAAVYLASKASSMVTGTVLNVDGGHTAR